ncbi:tRNA pseudouridine synthase [Fragilaria crotonensis]|nr:tRNA pseudouridine synthase [Fragilaria crotonensis]
MIGRGLEEPSVVSELLNVEKHPGKPSYPLAPERPLVLHHCGFHDLRVGHTAHNMWSTHCELERQWEELVLAAARIRNCIESMHEMDVMHIDLVTFARLKIQERFKKQHNRCTQMKEGLEKLLETLTDGLVSVASVNDSRLLISWKDALGWLKTKQLVPSPEGARETAHIPLIQRHMGTTYEEKIAALSNSKRRHARYDDNVIKKRKTKEEDAAFYVHMTKQGGSAM